MKCHFWRLIFLPFKILQHVYKCLNKYAYVHICIWIYMDIYIHILDLPSLLLCSQISIKLDCCWVEDQLFSTEADQRLASIRSSLCWGLHWELFSVIFFSYVALASNDNRFRLTNGAVFPLEWHSGWIPLLQSRGEAAAPTVGSVFRNRPSNSSVLGSDWRALQVD